MPSVSTSALDQWRAAATETAGLLGLLTVRMHKHETEHGPLWARRIIRDRTLRLTAGDASLVICRHLPAPCPVVLPSWAPVMVCLRCAGVVVPEPGPDEEHRCDSCRRVVPTLSPTVVSTGPVMVVGALCEMCSGAETK